MIFKISYLKFKFDKMDNTKDKVEATQYIYNMCVRVCSERVHI